MTGREASFVYKGKRFRFEVEMTPPLRVIYSHRECANGAIERLELILVDIDPETQEAIYQVIEQED